MRWYRSFPIRLASAAGLCLLLLSSASSAPAYEPGTLKIQVVDDATGDPIPVRLSLRASDGTYPGDRMGMSADRWPNIDGHAVFIDGAGSFALPPGKTSITAARGLEYKAQSIELELKAGATVERQIRLKRVVDLRKLGWVSGDLHVHMIHGENQRQTSYEDVALTCRANGLGFVSVGQEYVGAVELDLQGYKARCLAVSTDDFSMFLGGERPKNILGHQVLLGCENPFVISEEAPYFKSAAAIRKQGGVSVYVHPVRYYPAKQYGGQWLDFPGNNLARELIFDAYAGPAFDGISVLSDEPANADAHRLWFNLLNRGFFVPAFADSDACFDRPTLGFKLPGLWSTYFYIGPDQAITEERLCDAVRNGRTMATTGPLVQFQIDGKASGASLRPDGRERTVKIEAQLPQHAFSLESVDRQSQRPVGISRVELIRNGEVVKTWEPGAGEVQLDHTIRESEPCWYVLRVFGSDERWQVAIASPIYFSAEPVPRKREPRQPVVRGNIYDFEAGEARSARVEVRRHGELLHAIDAKGQFTLRMPLDGEITVRAEGERSITKNLLMEYGPIHRFLWYLESQDLGKPETLDRFEFLTREIALEFPIGYRMPGSYVAKPLKGSADLKSIRVLGGPDQATNGSVAVAAVLTDAAQIAPGETIQVAAIFRDEGAAADCGPYVVEARGYDPSRPTGFGALKRFASFERTWDTAEDLGSGYKLVRGEIAVPMWVEPGPAGWVDLSIRARKGHGDAAFTGLAIPLGETERALTISSSWPTMPVSWPDRSYGIGPFKVCNRIGRKAQPIGDYRLLQLSVAVDGRELQLLPAKDGKGCVDAEDAMYTDHYLDQILNDESKLIAR
jgi:hypothetical protein